MLMKLTPGGNLINKICLKQDLKIKLLYCYYEVVHRQRI